MSGNLFHQIQTQEEIRQILAAHPCRPLVPPLDSEAWRDAAANPLLKPLASAIRARAEKEAGEPMPVLTDELYGIFHRTGSRWEFEVVYFERRRRLARAAMALLLSEKEDAARDWMVPSLLAKVKDVLDEPSWAFPAHVDVRWVYQGYRAVTDGKNPFIIDLFAAETANLMGELLDYFGAIIPGDLRERILARLRKQFWNNYLGKEEFPEFWWTKLTNNWNAVCHQGVIGSALAALDDPDLLAQMLFRTKQALPHFLSGFGKDGGSSEGPGYWDYGFGWFSMLNEQLETRTGGQLSLFTDDPHVLEIARFGPRASLSGGQLVCFSDSHAKGILRPSTLVYLGKRLGDSLCMEQGLNNYALQLAEPPNIDAQRTDLFCLARHFLKCPAELPKQRAATAGKNVYLPDLAIVITGGIDERGHLWEIAAKAGHNAEHHNHNDCGSYIVNIDAHRCITEIGAPLYDQAFFGPKRYENLAARTLGHSLPLINGCEQAEGRDHAAMVLEYRDTPGETLFSMDIAACYPREAGCRKLVRTFRFEKKAGRFSVRDEFDLAEFQTVETAVMTIHPAVCYGNSVHISTGPLTLALRLEKGTTVASINGHQYRSHDPAITGPVTIQRIVLKPGTAASQFTLGFTAELV